MMIKITPREATKMVDEFQAEEDAIALRLQSYLNPETKYGLKETKRCDEMLDNLSASDLDKLETISRFVHKQWMILTATDTLMPINPYVPHATHVDIFINNRNTIKKNVNKQKQNTLKDQIDNINRNHGLFQNNDFIHTALALFVNNKIHYRQYESLQMQYQLTLPFIGTSNDPYQPVVHCILNESGKFTAAAEKYFLANLNKTFIHFHPGNAGVARGLATFHNNMIKENLDAEKIENFRITLQAFIKLHPSENFFLLTPVPQAELQKDRHLRTSVKLGAIVLHPENDTLQKVHLSCVARDALRLACYGVNDTVHTHMKAGVSEISDVWEAVSNNARVKAVTLPETPCQKEIHDLIASAQTKSDHDDYHADLMSRLGRIIRHLLLEFIKLSRYQLLVKDLLFAYKPENLLFSKGIWMMTDGEMGAFNTATTYRRTREKVEVTFCDAMSVDKRFKPLFYNDNGELTDVGFVIFFDMIENKQKWQVDIGFNPAFMTDPYQNSLNSISSLQDDFRPNDLVYNVLLYRIRMLVGANYFDIWKQTLDDNFHCIKDNLAIKRNNKKNFLGIIDKQINSLPLIECIKFTILSVLNFGIDEYKLSFDDYKVDKLVHSYLTVKTSVTNNYIQTRVLDPFKKLIKHYIEHENINQNLLEEIKNSLDKFIAHHQQSSSRKLSKYRLDHLIKASTLIEGAIFKLNEVGFRKGFLRP